MFHLTMARRTLKNISYYPSPQELYGRLISNKGWEYKVNKEFYEKRDKALIALTYLLATRISETLRLKKSQFEYDEENNRFVIRGIQLSKSTLRNKLRREQYRQVAYLPLKGEREGFTLLVSNYLDILGEEDRLFNFKRDRAYHIISGRTGEPCQWLRAYGENYFFDNWDKDILAVSDYIKVDVRTLSQYIRGGYRKYKAV